MLTHGEHRQVSQSLKHCFSCCTARCFLRFANSVYPVSRQRWRRRCFCCHIAVMEAVVCLEFVSSSQSIREPRNCDFGRWRYRAIVSYNSSTYTMKTLLLDLDFTTIRFYFHLAPFLLSLLFQGSQHPYRDGSQNP